MGCTDRGTNYNAHIYNEDRQAWMCAWSPGVLSYEAADKERVLERTGTEALDEWDLVQLDSGNWKATSKEPLLN